MYKLNWIKFILLIGISFLLFIKESYAFFTPSSLQLLAASIGPWIQFLLIVIITAIITLYMKTKKLWNANIKKILIFTLIILIFIIGFRFFGLKKINTINGPFLVSDLSDKSLSQIEEIYDKTWIIYDEKFQEEKFIYLDTINSSEYHSYKKITIYFMGNEYAIKNNTHIHFDKLWEAIYLGPIEIENLLISNNISKNDKILFICHTGHGSKLISYYFNKNGYDTYYAKVNDINNKDFIDSKKINEYSKTHNIIVESINFKKDENYFVFLFDIDENNMIGRFSVLVKDKKLKDNIYAIKAFNDTEIEMQKRYPDTSVFEIDKINLTDLNFVCLSQLHCFLTKYKIDSFNLGIDKIYYPGDIKTFNK